MQHIGVQRTGIKDTFLTLLLRCKGKVGDLLLQIINIRSLVFIGHDIRHLKFQFFLHFLYGSHSFLLLFGLFALQALPAIISKALTMIQVVTGQAEVLSPYVYLLVAVGAAEDAIAGGGIIIGFVLEPQRVDETTLTVAFLTAISAAIADLIDDPCSFAFFALVRLQLMLHTDYSSHRQVPSIILRVTFEQIHPLFPLIFQLEEGNLDGLL